MAEVTDVVKVPTAWAKSRPWIFLIFVFVLVLLVLRFRHQIARLISKIPKLGPWLVGGKNTVVPATSTTPAPAAGDGTDED